MRKLSLIIVAAIGLTACTVPSTTFENHTRYIKDSRTDLCFITTTQVDDFVMEEVECTPDVESNLTNQIDASTDD